MAESDESHMMKRSLYRVWVIDPRGAGKVLMEGKPVIADNENQALMKAGAAQAAAENGLDIEQVDTYAEHVSRFIRMRRETQKVRIAKDGDE